MAGHCFIDSEKLLRLSMIKNSRGSSVNLNWLITGRGPILLSNSEFVEQDDLFIKLRVLPHNKIEAIIQLLDL